MHTPQRGTRSLSPTLSLCLCLWHTHTRTHSTEHSRSFSLPLSVSFCCCHTHIVTVPGSGQLSVIRYPSPFALPWLAAPESVPEPTLSPSSGLTHPPCCPLLPALGRGHSGPLGPGRAGGKSPGAGLVGLPAPLPLSSADRVRGQEEAGRGRAPAGSRSRSGPRVSPAGVGLPRSAAACPALQPAARCPSPPEAGAREGASARRRRHGNPHACARRSAPCPLCAGPPRGRGRLRRDPAPLQSRGHSPPPTAALPATSTNSVPLSGATHPGPRPRTSSLSHPSLTPSHPP